MNRIMMRMMGLKNIPSTSKNWQGQSLSYPHPKSLRTGSCQPTDGGMKVKSFHLVVLAANSSSYPWNDCYFWDDVVYLQSWFVLQTEKPIAEMEA